MMVSINTAGMVYLHEDRGKSGRGLICANFIISTFLEKGNGECYAFWLKGISVIIILSLGRSYCWICLSVCLSVITVKLTKATLHFFLYIGRACRKKEVNKFG